MVPKHTDHQAEEVKFLYLEWGTSDLQGLESLGISRLVTEVAKSGEVRRELGFDEAGVVVYRAPSLDEPYGLFDLQVIEVEGLESSLSEASFEAHWAAEEVPPE